MSNGTEDNWIRSIDLGRIGYREAYQEQRTWLDRVIAAREEPDDGLGRAGVVLLLEHDPPVVTVSRRPGAREHLLATDEQLRAQGVVVEETDRGGDITYHGPGQLVAYPIIDLNAFGLNLHGYMRLLERVVIDVCAGFGVEAHRDGCATGVWVGGDVIETNEDGACAGTGGEKICAMGVRVRRWVTMHGLALNVRTNLDHFDLIVPCGLAGRPVTSLQRELGEDGPGVDEVKDALVESMERAFIEIAEKGATPGSGRRARRS